MNLHHVGVVVKSVTESAELYVNQMGMRALGPPVQDDIQRVIVQFLIREGDTTSIELIEPVDGNSPVASLLRKGGGLAHLCYEVEDMEASLESAQQKGALVISGPVPAAAFHQLRVAFLFYRGIGVIEFLEKAVR
jgi:methylmalonyl-CoA/ethylmalonyl-CoA epimerase